MNDGHLIAFPVLEVSPSFWGIPGTRGLKILKLVKKPAQCLPAVFTIRFVGLICFVFLGRWGCLCAFYRILGSLCVSGGFPWQALHTDTHEKETWQEKQKVRADIFVLALSSLFTGGLLNLSGLKRPEVYQRSIQS
jgi:hypothetical protein